MSLGPSVEQIVYPESDGKPMGETDVHIDWMIRIRDILKYRYRGQQVYVASNLLVYYEEGNPQKYVVPDDFVALDCDPARRRTFKVWEEQKPPNVVFEVTSRGTQKEDRKIKPETYARIGVQELFLYDPTAEYLKPALQGFRLVDGEFTAVKPNKSGLLRCNELNIGLRLESGELVFIGLQSGKRLPTEAEAEKAAREAAEARAAKLQAELERLRDKDGQQPES